MAALSGIGNAIRQSADNNRQITLQMAELERQAQQRAQDIALARQIRAEEQEQERKRIEAQQKFQRELMIQEANLRDFGNLDSASRTGLLSAGIDPTALDYQSRVSEAVRPSVTPGGVERINTLTGPFMPQESQSVAPPFAPKAPLDRMGDTVPFDNPDRGVFAPQIPMVQRGQMPEVQTTVRQLPDVVKPGITIRTLEEAREEARLKEKTAAENTRKSNAMRYVLAAVGEGKMSTDQAGVWWSVNVPDIEFPREQIAGVAPKADAEIKYKQAQTALANIKVPYYQQFTTNLKREYEKIGAQIDNIDADTAQTEWLTRRSQELLPIEKQALQSLTSARDAGTEYTEARTKTENDMRTVTIDLAETRLQLQRDAAAGVLTPAAKAQAISRMLSTKAMLLGQLPFATGDDVLTQQLNDSIAMTEQQLEVIQDLPVKQGITKEPPGKSKPTSGTATDTLHAILGDPRTPANLKKNIQALSNAGIPHDQILAASDVQAALQNRGR